MPPLKLIKLEAKKSLGGFLASGMGVGALLLSVLTLHIVIFEIVATVAINFLNDYIAPLLAIGILIIVTPFFACPLLYGALRWFWFSCDQKDIPINEVFCYFSSGREYLKAVSLSFRIFLRIGGIIILCFSPSIIVFILSNPDTYELLNTSIPYWASYIWFLSSVLNVFGIIMSFILMLRYFSAPILMINDANLSPTEALNLSGLLYKNAGSRTFNFIFSYFGWFLLSLLLLPIIFTLPLFLTGYSVYCKCLIDYYNSNVAIKSGNYFTAPRGNI